jgi:2-methylcitrate dehydratase PrpD
MSKPAHLGMASRDGLSAAVVAQGWSRSTKRGKWRDGIDYLCSLNDAHTADADQIIDGLGRYWETDRITVKWYPAMGWLRAAVDAVSRLQTMRSLVSADIVAIDVDLAPTVSYHEAWLAKRPQTPIAAQLNLAYAVAVAILDQEALAGQFSSERINRDDVWELIPRIRVRHDQRSDRASKLGESRNRLRVHFRDGGTLETAIRVNRDTFAPLTNEKVVAKYRALTAEVVSAERQKSIESLVLNVEQLRDIRPLVAALAAPARRALGD